MLRETKMQKNLESMHDWPAADRPNPKESAVDLDHYILPILSAMAATSPAPFPLPSSLRNVLNLQLPEYLRVYLSRSSLRLGCSL